MHDITMEVCDMPPEKCILPLNMCNTLPSMIVLGGKLASARHGSLGGAWAGPLPVHAGHLKLNLPLVIDPFGGLLWRSLGFLNGLFTDYCQRTLSSLVPHPIFQFLASSSYVCHTGQGGN